MRLARLAAKKAEGRAIRKQRTPAAAATGLKKAPTAAKAFSNGCKVNSFSLRRLIKIYQKRHGLGQSVSFYNCFSRPNECIATKLAVNTLGFAEITYCHPN